MKRPWPQAHRNLAAITALCLVAAGAVYVFFLHPKVQEVEDLELHLEDLQKKLKDSGWPLNADSLEALLNESTRKLKGTKQGERGIEGFETRAQRIVDRAASTFSRHIEDTYTTPHTFVDQAGWLDYQSDFTNLENWLRGHEIIISERTFGISQDTADVETYQLLLQLWTVRELVQLLLEHDLVLAKDRSAPVPTPEGRAVLPSRLRVLPVRSYVLNDDDQSAYLLEFPVRMTVRGTIQDLTAFIGSLQKDDRFLPITRLELVTENPAFRGSKPGSDGFIRVENIEATVVCSAFFRPPGGAPAMRVKQEIKVPRGA